MSMTQRVLLSAGILLVDLIVFFLPLTATVMARKFGQSNNKTDKEKTKIQRVGF